MYWLILRRPCSPSLLELLELRDDDGQQLHDDATRETYGMMPSAKIDSCSSAPPENMLNMPEERPDAWLHDLRHDVAVDARGRDEDADAIDREHHQREQDPPAQLRDLAMF